MSTEERDARAAQLREMIDRAIERLAAQLAQGHTAEFKRLLAFWSRFHRYSHGNVLLILSQRPDATQVAGYHTWRRVGRQVRKGAKAIAIWCPLVRTIEDLVDIATNPLPTLWRALPNDVEGLYQQLKHRIEASGHPVTERPLPFGRQGASSPDGKITLATGLDSRNRILVLLHELAHQLEHFRPERQEASRDQKELEAESASMVVCAMLGLEHPTARDYILMYHGDAEALKASLAAIHRLVGTMVKLLDPDRLPAEVAVALAA